MKSMIAVIIITLLALVGAAFAKSPNHDDFPMTFRVISVDRQQEVAAGYTYWVYQYHITVTSGGTPQGYTVQWFPKWRWSTCIPLDKRSVYLARLVNHNHAFQVVQVDDRGKEVTDTFTIIGVD